MTNRKNLGITFFFRHFLLLAVILIFWQIFSCFIYPRFNPTASNILPPPSSVLSIGWELLKNGKLFVHILASLRRIIMGFLLAVVLGIPLGVLMGISRNIRLQMTPLIELLRPIPPFAWLPLALLWFGIGDRESIFLIVIAAIFPIVLNTVEGIDKIDIRLLHAAQSLGCQRKRELLLKILLPASLPSIFLGFRVGLGFSWMVLVGAEMIGSISGLGYLILDSRNLVLPNLALLGMAIIGVIGYFLDLGMRRLSNLILIWAEES